MRDRGTSCGAWARTSTRAVSVPRVTLMPRSKPVDVSRRACRAPSDGKRSGQPSARLGIEPRRMRGVALAQLSAGMEPAVLADVVGVSPATAVKTSLRRWRVLWLE